MSRCFFIVCKVGRIFMFSQESTLCISQPQNHHLMAFESFSSTIVICPICRKASASLRRSGSEDDCLVGKRRWCSHPRVLLDGASEFGNGPVAHQAVNVTLLFPA